MKVGRSGVCMWRHWTRSEILWSSDYRVAAAAAATLCRFLPGDHVVSDVTHYWWRSEWRHTPCPRHVTSSPWYN